MVARGGAGGRTVIDVEQHRGGGADGGEAGVGERARVGAAGERDVDPAQAVARERGSERGADGLDG